MKQALLCVLSIVFLSTFIGLSGEAVAGELHPRLQAQLNTLPSDAPVSVIIHLSEQTNIEAIDISLIKEKATRARRHETVVRALKEVASRSQVSLISHLEDKKAEGSVFGYTSHWISNLVIAKVTKEEIYRLNERTDVDFIELNFEFSLVEPIQRGKVQNGQNGPQIDGIGVTPGLYAIQADRVWNELGITGAGRLVANMDTGVDGSHPALADRWRGTLPGVEPSAAWLDVLGGGSNFPVDSGSHGTHVMGTETGLGVATGDTIGVAWGAYWIACNAIGQGTGPEFDNDVITALEWFADPDGDPGTVDDVPDVVQNSWRINENFGYNYEDCDDRWWAAIDNCEASGVVLTWSAGNEGPGAETVGSPPDRITTPFNVYAVGAVDATNYSYPYPTASFSSRGPSGCDHVTVKPEVTAPGVDVYSSVPGGGYQGGWSGTSMSGPHVAGVVGLMREANPNLTVEQIKGVLMLTAHDFGTPGEDNTYGMGFIDAYESVLMVMSGMGFLMGTVTDAGSGDPVPANLSVLGTSKVMTADPETGAYRFVMMGDTTYTIQASYFGYETMQQSIYLAPDDTTFLDFELVTSPAGPLTGLVMDYDTGLPVQGATVQVLDTPISPTTTSSRGMFKILGVPAGATYTVQASAQGFGANTEEKTIEEGQLNLLALPLKSGFSDAMETGAPGWIHYNVKNFYSDQWHLSTQRNHTGGGDTSWKCGSTGSGGYGYLVDAALETPVIELEEGSKLFFWHWMDAQVHNANQAVDGSIVEISINGGTFTQITPVGGYPYTIYPNPLNPFPAGTPCFSGSHDWKQEVFDLSGYSGDAVIRFRFGSEGTGNDEGWYIDDVIVGKDVGAQPVSILMVPHTYPISIDPTGGSFNYSVALVNNTGQSLTFDWWIDVTRQGGPTYGPIMTESLTLAPGEQYFDWNLEQTIPGWVPAGTYLYNAKVGLLPNLVTALSSFEFTKTGTAAVEEDAKKAGDAQEIDITGWELKSIR